MEQNVYLIMKMADEVTKHQLKREETALQYKKYNILVDMCCSCMILCDIFLVLGAET